MSADGALTVVVTRVIKPGCEADFERTMREFLDVAWTFPGHLGMHMLRPAENQHLSGEYTIIARFDSMESRRVFTSSEVFKEWMARMDSQSSGPAVVRELQSLRGWAALAGETVNPPRWKMAITVWVGVATLSQVFTWLFTPIIGHWPRQLQMLPITAITIVLLTWFVLPAMMRMLNRWYFPHRGRAAAARMSRKRL